MRALLLCFVAVSFLTTTLTLRCSKGEDTKSKDLKNDEPAETTLNQAECNSTTSWCYKIAFDGTYNSKGRDKAKLEIESEGTIFDCADFPKLAKKCDDIGEDCEDLSEVNFRPNMDVTGDVELCCCKTDLCNASHKIVPSAIFAILVIFLFCRIF